MTIDRQHSPIEFLRAIDKLDRLGTEGVFDLLTDGRRDASGDVTAGVGLSAVQGGCVMEFLRCAAGGSNNETLFRMQRWQAVMAMEPDRFAVLYDALKLIGMITPEDEAFAGDDVAIREFYGTKTEKPTWR